MIMRNLDPNKISGKDFFMMTIYVQGGILILGIVLSFLFKIELLQILNFNLSAIIVGSIAGTTLALIIAAVYKSRFKIFKKLQKDLTKTLKVMSGFNFFQILLISFIAGLTEEIFFRGFLQQVIEINFGLVTALIISGILFGVMHYISNVYTVYIFFVSAVFGLIFVFTENLWGAIFAHFLFDLVGISLGLKLRNEIHP